VNVAIRFDAFGIEERLNDGRLPAGHDERGIDFAGNQFLGRDLRRKPR
jgi:hypothetical protein